jgi:uncharacterized protein (TIGR03083 family)
VLDHLQILRDEGNAFVAALDRFPLDTPVPSCPGWDVRALAHHLGYIHRWARLAVVTAAPPDDSAIEPPPDAQIDESEALVMWMARGVDALESALAERDPLAPTWHPFTVERTVGVWRRRQAHELAIHRWDLEHADDQRARAEGQLSHAPTPFRPEQAADHVGEYFGVIVPRVIQRDARVAPIGSVTVELTDAGTSFQVVSDGHSVTIGDAVHGAECIRGTAGDVLLALWRRQALPDGALDGESPTAAAWLRFGGN